MHGEDRAVRRDAVEILAREVSLFLEHGVVVAKADQPTISGLVRVRLFERVERLWDCPYGADGRTVQVRRNRDESGSWKMAMRFDEPRDDRTPIEIEHDVRVWQPTLHVTIAADRDNSIVFHDECRRLRALGVHGEDSPVGPDLKPRR